MRGGIRRLYARPRVIRGTRVKPLPLLPSGPGGVRGRPLHEARSLTTSHASRFQKTLLRKSWFPRHNLGGRAAQWARSPPCMKVVMVDDSAVERKLCRLLLGEAYGSELEFFEAVAAEDGLKTVLEV